MGLADWDRKIEQVLRARTNLVCALWNQGRYAEAEQEYRQLVDRRAARLRTGRPSNSTAMGNLAIVVKSQGRFAEAETLNREVLAADQRVMGPEHPATAYTMENLSARC